MIRTVGGTMASEATKKVGMRGQTPIRQAAALFEKGLHLVEKAVAVGFHRHAAFLGEFHQQFALLGGQFGGNMHFDREQLIAGCLMS